MYPDKAGPCPPLLRVRGLCPQDGPPLSLGQQLRRLQQLQVFFPLPPLRVRLLHFHRLLRAQVFPSVLVPLPGLARSEAIILSLFLFSWDVSMRFLSGIFFTRTISIWGSGFDFRGI